MSKRADREEFISIMAQEGISLDVSRALLRAGATLHRLAEAQCNGDWPADNGERTTRACARCECHWHPSVLKRGDLCPDCRTQDRVTALCQSTGLSGFVPVFGGDPRGAVLLVTVPSGRTNDFGRRGIVVG